MPLQYRFRAVRADETCGPGDEYSFHMIARAFSSLYNRSTMAAITGREQMLRDIAALLSPLGITLADEQPHISGERELLSIYKLVLVGHDKGGSRVVIKASREPGAIKDIKHEKSARDTLRSLSFAPEELRQAEELYAGERDGYYFLVTAYIEQDQIFVTRPLEEQFFIALGAFEAQESFHMTTYEHRKEVRNAFKRYTPDTYLELFRGYMDKVPTDQMDQAYQLLVENRNVLLRYGDYLTHNDFVPHNMRLNGRSLYVLDLSSFWFGNKYEGWARFLNYMLIHNPDLEEKLDQYLQENRADEYLCLRLMRVYKAGELLAYYAGLYPKTEGDLRLLTEERLTLWSEVLESLLLDQKPPRERIMAYRERRNGLRTEEEKQRQREFAET